MATITVPRKSKKRGSGTTAILRTLPDYWVLIEWVDDDPRNTMHGPYASRDEAYMQARYFRASGMWSDTVKNAYVVGNGYPREKEA